MRTYLLLLSLTLYCTGVFAQGKADTLKKFSVQELKSDFDELRSHLEKYHAGLYWYTPKKDFDLFFDSLKSSIKEEMTDLEFFKIISQVIEKTHERHTRYGISALDTSSNVLKVFKDGLFLPLSMAFTNNKSYVYANLSTDSSLQRGAEILSINGRSMRDIEKEMFRYIVADGYNTSSKFRDMDKHFESYYYWYIERPDTFKIEYIDLEGNLKKTSVAALSIDSMNKVAEKRYWFELSKQDSVKVADLEVKSEIDLAILRIDSFREQDYKSDGIVFKDFVIQSFSKLQDKDIHNLVIDLRGNQGGKISYMYFLLSYLLNNPNRVVLMRTAKSPVDSARKPIKSPKLDPTRFKGNIYILAEARTYSAASMMTSILKYFRKAKVIGWETGGGYYGTSAGFFKNITLTNTRIRVEAPLIRYELNVEGQDKGRGVFPDYEIIYSKEALMNGKDEMLEFVYELIKQGK